jgi:hypothetical protein
LASGLRALYPGVPPQVALIELGAGEGTDRCSAGRQEQARLLEDWCRTRRLCIPKSALEIGFVGAGAEHETYFDVSGYLAVKITHDGGFGHCLREEGAISTPFEYLQHLAWHNELFGDDIQFHGILLESAGLRLVSSQSWIVSHPAKLSPIQSEIDAFLSEFGFDRSTAYPEGFIYFNPSSGLVIGDAQPANLLLDREGVIRPIDLVIAEPSEAFRQRLLAGPK